jgi:hypothetical protein
MAVRPPACQGGAQEKEEFCAVVVGKIPLFPSNTLTRSPHTPSPCGPGGGRSSPWPALGFNVPPLHQAAYAANGVPFHPSLRASWGSLRPPALLRQLNAATVAVPIRAAASTAPCGTSGSRNSLPTTPSTSPRVSTPRPGVSQAAFCARTGIRYASFFFSNWNTICTSQFTCAPRATPVRFFFFIFR